MNERTPEHVWHDFDLVMRAHRHAAEAHRDDLRKATTIPYQSHLWSVAALALEHGADDAQVAAALLHDTVEDHGGLAELARIRGLFGEDVASMVHHLSDSTADTDSGQVKPPWQERKTTYVAHLAELAAHGDRAVLVSACDKLHNLRCILADYRQVGDELWGRFNVNEPAAHLWYYGCLLAALTGAVPGALTDELRRTLDEMTQLVREANPGLDVDAYAEKLQAGE